VHRRGDDDHAKSAAATPVSDAHAVNGGGFFEYALLASTHVLISENAQQAKRVAPAQAGAQFGGVHNWVPAYAGTTSAPRDFPSMPVDAAEVHR
jgi:hypothetical protein